MPTERLILVGAGGHGKVVLDALMRAEPGVGVDWRDGDTALSGQVWEGQEISAPELPEDVRGVHTHIAIGRNRVRRALAQRVKAGGGILAAIVHPSAYIAKGAAIGAGCFIAAGAIIGPDAKLAEGVIVNHNAVVDHDCDLGPFAHIAPGAVLGGGVIIGAGTLVGSGASVLPLLTIGPDVVLGAGASATCNLIAGTFVGSPARAIEEQQS
ncbi:MAG: NeuD/PglB/VioB family sugar acetyltransferase [Erythrobacter sp.]|jgi:sugar O-acyltransferase (sialic acid O-acetyltransferase NeuD family)|nr:NeuD/PglB/VioB family sugar acetyltransferase [Erythrobacter sp.]